MNAISSDSTSSFQRVLSGMRPTGALHLGHLHGALNNWVKLQSDYDCFYFVADWHALTTHYETPELISQHIHEMLIDWLAAGLDPEQATIFLQSRVPQHAELSLLLGMFTPLAWLERVPTYKDQMQRLTERDLATYGFLGYPLMQAADILIYGAELVPVGEDQLPHIEMTREIARRFNHLFGRESDFSARLKSASEALGKPAASLYFDLRKRYQQNGEMQAYQEARRMVVEAPITLSHADRGRLIGYLEGDHRAVLKQPQALLTEAARLPGLDGQKMSKSYNNTIALRDEPKIIDKKIRQMPTDPARVRRTDPGEPSRCPVWSFHKVYSDAARQDWVLSGCRSATIGCLECKQPIIDAVCEELAPIRERAQALTAQPKLIKDILEVGCQSAREQAEITLREVRQVMGLIY